MSALYLLDPAAVGTSNALSKSEVLEALAERFARVYDLDAPMVLEAMEERERLGSTGFGRGVAIPHARIPGLRRPVCVVMRLTTPVSFDSADGLPVEIAFGLLSPDQSGATHLHALAAISRMLRDERLRDRLAEAPNDEAVFALLSEDSGRDAA
ncbi:PTS sugar transporter subunit IIA [Croceicoccus naphthovorans]|uniref:PTS IIA-like nitrogen-regulatory protein PtsN n=1 Tax=Croceicoccus naphthovorans TaxID=1348774 RepID=A0A0G3XJ45_9SPHN|nr:PTS sugar transporter subunit IIA [Croceicoccus naphthovorans]AKM11212.1 PTS IIA-like nitrogen-regulatory protein PtsN [Croceicoccus naphthovorans]MBB3989889.1 PTS system nitrogen regulatory IIA component [Croceicoccus naphthovorans]